MSESFSDTSNGGQPETQDLTFTDGLLGGQPWLDEPENGPTFFPELPLAQDEPSVIKNFDPERQSKLDFVLPALSQTEATAKPTPPPEASRSRFHDPEALDARWDATDDGFDYTPEMKAEVYNRIGIAREYGDSLDDIVDIYPVLRGQYGHEVLGNYDISEIELDRHFRDQAKFKKALEKSVADIPGRITADLIGSMISGKPVSAEEGYQRWKDEHPELLGKFPDTPVLEAAKRFYDETAAQLAPYGKQIRELNDYLAWKTGQTSQSSESEGPGADERREQLLDNLATMPQELRDLIFPAIVDGAQRLGALDDKSVGEQTYELFGRNINIVSGAVLNAKEFAAEAELDRLKAGTPLFQTPDGRLLDSPRYLRAGPLAQPLTDEQRAARIAKTEHTIARLGLDRQLEDLATNGYDAVRNRHTGILGFLETGLYGTASSAGYTAVVMIPVAGPYLAMSAAMSDTYTDLKLKYPKAKSSDLRRVAVVSGALQGMLELFKARAIFGKVPALERAMNRWANPAFVGGAHRAGKRLVTTLAAENAMEAAQDLTTPLVQDVCAALGMDIPGVKWKEVFGPFVEARPETFAALVPMVVLGVFGISMHENRRLQSQPERLKIWKSVGFNSEQISEIEQGGTVEEKQAKARELINHRTPEAIKEGIRMVEAEQDAANAKHFDPEQTTTLSPGLLAAENRSEESTADDLTKMPEPDMTSFDVRNSEPLTGPDAERAIDKLNETLVRDNAGWTARLLEHGASGRSQRTEAARLARGISALFGRRVVIFETDFESAPNAIVNTSAAARGVTFLNNAADRPHLLTLGHELYHHMEVSAPELAEQLKNELKPLVANWDKIHQEKANYPADRHFDEVVGDLVGSSLADKRFWNKLEAGNPELFSKVAVIVRDWLTKLINALNQAGLRGNEHFTDLERARNIVADALVQFSKHPFSGKGKIGPYELYDPNQNFYEDSSEHHLQESESRRHNSPELDLEEGDRARKLLDNFQPVEYPVPNLPKSDNLLPYWDWFKANLENRTFTSPIGKLVPFKRGQFLKLIAGGGNKGFIPGATNWKEIVEKIEGGQVHLDNPETAPSGFEQYRVRNMPLIPDVVQEPHVILRSKDDPRTLIFLKKYELDKVSIWQGVFVDLGDEAAIKSWRPRNRISEDWLKDHLLVWEKK